jgi:hypothetical protein
VEIPLRFDAEKSQMLKPPAPASIQDSWPMASGPSSQQQVPLSTIPILESLGAAPVTNPRRISRIREYIMRASTRPPFSLATLTER